MSAGPCYIKCTEKAQCRIGEKVFMNHNCSITSAEEITIGDACNIANNVVIVANTVILKGVSIEDGAVIAAGAVVNYDIPAYEIWGGVPAKKIRVLTNEENMR